VAVVEAASALGSTRSAPSKATGSTRLRVGIWTTSGNQCAIIPRHQMALNRWLLRRGERHRGGRCAAQAQG
jgi:hypothetical protein